MTTADRAPTRVLLADDHALVRRGVRLILDAEPDLTVVAEAGDGAEAVDLARARDVDLAVLDIAMPRMTGLQAARERSRRIRPQVRRRPGPRRGVPRGDPGRAVHLPGRRDHPDPQLPRPGPPRGSAARPCDHRTRGGDPQTRRRGPLLQGDRRHPRDQRQDGGAPSREPAAETGDARPPGTDPLRDPCGSDRAIAAGTTLSGTRCTVRTSRGVSRTFRGWEESACCRAGAR